MCSGWTFLQPTLSGLFLCPLCIGITLVYLLALLPLNLQRVLAGSKAKAKGPSYNPQQLGSLAVHSCPLGCLSL